MINVSFSVVGGVRMATLPADELERLAEAAEDRADVRAAEAAELRRAGGEEYLPADMARRMIAGESPLRIWRQYRDMTLSTLGDRAGIKASYLSEMELGKKPGSPGVWRRLATALNVSVDDIMPDDD